MGDLRKEVLGKLDQDIDYVLDWFYYTEFPDRNAVVRELHSIVLDDGLPLTARCHACDCLQAFDWSWWPLNEVRDFREKLKSLRETPGLDVGFKSCLRGAMAGMHS